MVTTHESFAPVLGYTSQSRQKKTVYADPTFEEMLTLCRDFGIVSEAYPLEGGYILRILDEKMQLRREAAHVLLKGLLLGYFFNHSRDDLSLAEWHA